MKTLKCSEICLKNSENEKNKFPCPGAGTGGIVTANELSKNGGDDVRVVLIEKSEKNIFAPSLLWLLVGKRKPQQVYRSTKKLASGKIEVLIGEIETVDPKSIAVTVGGKEYVGDHMVISLGVEQKDEHDLNRFGFDFFTLDGANGFHAASQL